MARPADFVRLMRPLNAAMAAWAVLVGAAVAVPIWGYQDFPWPEALTAMAAAFLVLAFGNAANDIADRDIDRAAHPTRPLPAGRLTVGQAAVFATVLANAGLVLAVLAGGLWPFALAAGNAILLLLYARWLKGVPALGHVVVAWLAASAFLFGALAIAPGRSSPAIHWGSLWGFAAMAFLATLARETAKGLQDAPHDEGRRTLARVAPAAARGLVLAATLAAVALAAWMVLDVPHPWWLDRPMAWDGVGSGPQRLGLHDEHLGYWRHGVALSIPVFLGGAALVLSSPARSQAWLKAGMLVAMLGYSWAALQSFQGN